jgi:hypothetical protein
MQPKLENPEVPSKAGPYKADLKCNRSACKSSNILLFNNYAGGSLSNFLALL